MLMLTPERPLERISNDLLAYLRAELDAPRIAYQMPLTQMQGGYETCSFRLQLDGAPPELSGPLVLRLYPAFYGTSNAEWESTIQNMLADQGYPVARAHLTCTELSILGGAFYLMDLLPGELMITAPYETIPGLLGRAHARLHGIDPAPMVRALKECEFEQHRYRRSGRLARLEEQAAAHPWLAEAVSWLLHNCPPEPEQLSVCHGDFHPMNLLVQEGHVSGVLDWPGFLIADPVLDVANTVTLVATSGKHLLRIEQWELVVQMYLAAYQAERPLDQTHLDYYRVRRCVGALAEGANGQQVWRQPPVVRDLIEVIEQVTEVRIVPPAGP
jgi:aminoglycoside phosphotransferase (APT) family kinase protein